LGKGLKPERNFMDRPGKNVILLLLLLIVVLGSEFCIGQNSEGNKPIASPIERTQQAVSEGDQTVATPTTATIAATPTFTPTGHVMSSEDTVELYERRAIDKSREEVEKQLIWKYGIAITIIVGFLGYIFSNIISIYGPAIRKELKKIQDLNKSAEEAEKHLEKYRKTIQELESKVEEVKSEIDGININLNSLKELSIRSEINQTEPEKRILGLSEMLGSMTLKKINIVENDKLKDELKVNKKDFQRIIESKIAAKYQIKIFLRDGEKLNQELTDLGFITYFSPTSSQDVLQAIWISKNVPYEVLLPVLKTAHKHFLKLKYLELMGDHRLAIQNEIVIGGHIETVSELGLKALSDADFDELLSKKTIEEMHAFIHKFYKHEDS
jgi:hypothetical protein